MGKINQYLSVSLPKLDDKVVGTSVGGNPENATYNFTLAKLLELFENNFSAINIFISDTTEYADNAAAKTAGLENGQIYRTGDLLKIVH